MPFDLPFLAESFVALVRGIPLTLQLTVLSVVAGGILAFGLAFMRISRRWWLDAPARFYILGEGA